MSNQSRIEQLYRRWMDKTASEVELEELWASLSNESPEKIGELMSAQWQNEDGRFDYPEERRLQVLGAIIGREHLQRRAGVVQLRLLWRVAAAIVVLFAAAYWMWNSARPQRDVVSTPSTTSPSASGVILTLDDGSQVSLDTIRNGVLALKGGAKVRVSNSMLVYEGVGNEMVFNTISTPRGRQYQLRLPDGTNVWLNAGSSIRYPLHFSDTVREVAVTGETYFAVAKDVRAPFRVNVAGNMGIEVLGTEFNINAYENELQTLTTLISGKIRLKGKDNSIRPVLLLPGQQGFSDKSGQFSTKKADVERVIAWKQGVFHFNGAVFDEIMREVERWYDIEVKYEGAIPDIEFQGEISREISLADFLGTMQKFGVRYRQEGRLIIILP